MRITKITIHNFRGIEAREEQIPARGAVVQGANGRGKTSVLNAIRAALAGRDIGPDAIRNGADKAEILVDLDNLSVRRVITPASSSLTVHDANGFKAPKPQTYLSELLGTSPIDPLDLFLAKPKERRAKILAALPVSVTVEQLRRWAPSVPDKLDVSGHGLEVLERVRAHYYDERTTANKAAADAKRAYGDALKGLPSELPRAPTSSEAKASHDKAAGRVADLESRCAQASEAEARSHSTRARVTALRNEADAIVVTAVPDAEVQAAEGEVSLTAERVETLTAQLEDARRVARAAYEAQIDLLRRRDAARADAHKAGALRRQADEVEAALRATAAPAPTAEELADARKALDLACQDVDAARLRDEVVAAQQRANQLKAAAKTAQDAASDLDDVVQALTHDAPATLLESSSALPGLRIAGDDVQLDGVSLDALSGSEQMRFAIEIARRLNAKSRILIVDGLERVDPDQREQFVRYATADGYQLLATLVDRGEPVFAAIECDASPTQPTTGMAPAA